MKSTQEVPNQVLEALKQFGLKDSLLADLNSNSQIVSDLGIWGDDFTDFYEILSRIYGTDYLIPAECIPSEFAWARTIKGWLPFTDQKGAVPVASLTVVELDRVMRGLGLQT